MAVLPAVLVHQFDLMHGVDVTAGTRYSVALWFSDSPKSRALGLAPWVREGAEAGNPDAQFLQASFSAQGWFGNRLDHIAASRWLERGAAQGHATSQLSLGRLHATGCYAAGESSPAQAFANFMLAAEAGLAEAQFALGCAYLDGIGVEPSDESAAAWFGRAAEEGGEFGEAAALERDEILRRLQT